jgi:hypothetical protein
LNPDIKFPVKKISFTFTKKDFADIEQFIKDKFAEIEKYEDKPDDELPICTAKERFNKGDKYAVMKKGRKAALRLWIAMKMPKHGGMTRRRLYRIRKVKMSSARKLPCE